MNNPSPVWRVDPALALNALLNALGVYEMSRERGESEFDAQQQAANAMVRKLELFVKPLDNTTLAALQAENVELKKWKDTLIDQLVVNWAYKNEHENDPRLALFDYTEQEIRYALDPAISKDAEALIERGRLEERAIWLDVV